MNLTCNSFSFLLQVHLPNVGDLSVVLFQVLTHGHSFHPHTRVIVETVKILYHKLLPVIGFTKSVHVSAFKFILDFRLEPLFPLP